MTNTSSTGLASIRLQLERNHLMGDRACIVFYDSRSVSPTVYLHWHGEYVPAWLERLKRRMNGRFDDAGYAAARFIGICHEQIAGNLSLGVLQNTLTHADVRYEARMDDHSPGNAGLVVVDTREFTWKAYGGYLASTGRA
jgi:hypothetical protein